MSYYTGEDYDSRYARLVQKPGESAEDWNARMAVEIRKWEAGWALMPDLKAARAAYEQAE